MSHFLPAVGAGITAVGVQRSTADRGVASHAVKTASWDATERMRREGSSAQRYTKLKATGRVRYEFELFFALDLCPALHVQTAIPILPQIHQPNSKVFIGTRVFDMPKARSQPTGTRMRQENPQKRSHVSFARICSYVAAQDSLVVVALGWFCCASPMLPWLMETKLCFSLFLLCLAGFSRGVC
jgi:hypothetical protein